MTARLTGLEGKVAVVTGAGRMRSIGRSIAVELAKAGCQVALTGTGRPPESYPEDEKRAGWRDIDSVAEEIREIGSRARPFVTNVSDAESVEELASRVLEEFGRVDIVVNNAGAARGEDRRPLIDIEPEVWRNVMDVNLTGTFLMSRTFGRHLVEQGDGGSIVNISSIAGKRFDPGRSAYAASKAGIQAMTACMAREIGRSGVRVNAVCPGLVGTSRLDDMGRGKAWDELVDRIVPLGRAGTGADVAHLVVYLCSDEGAWVTGQSWNVDGGTVVQH